MRETTKPKALEGIRQHSIAGNTLAQISGDAHTSLAVPEAAEAERR
jgi:hypothetical protein